MSLITVGLLGVGALLWHLALITWLTGKLQSARAEIEVQAIEINFLRGQLGLDPKEPPRCT